MKLFKTKKIMVLAGLVFMTAASNVSYAANEVSYGSFVPPLHSVNKYGLAPWLADIQKETNGEITTILHSSGSIASGKATLSAVRDGLLDAGFIANIYTPDQMPVSMVTTNLAFLSKNPLVTVGALNETTLLGCKECDDEYKKLGIKALGSYVTPSYNLMCKKDVKDLADLKGLKMRAAGALYTRWAKAMGGVPVTMSNANAYEALERGQLDCVIGSTAWLKTLSLWDLTKYTIAAPMGSFMGGPLFAFSAEKWDSFTQEQQKIIIKLSNKYLVSTVLGYIKDANDVESSAKAKGVDMRSAGPNLAALINTHAKGELAVSVAAANKKGVKNAQAIADRFVANLKKWEGIVAKTGNDPEKFTEALWEHVYSKVK